MDSEPGGSNLGVETDFNFSDFPYLSCGVGLKPNIITVNTHRNVSGLLVLDLAKSLYSMHVLS